MINLHSSLIREDMRQMGVDAFAVLMCISAHINASRRAWPGIERIREMTGLTKDRTYKAIQVLIKLGHVERKQENKAGQWGKVVYRVTSKYIGVYMGASSLPFDAYEEWVEPLTGKPEHGYPLTGKPEHGNPVSISIEQAGSINKEEVLVKKEVNSLSPANEVDNFQPQHIWGDGTETRLQKAQAALKDYFEKNSFRRREISDAAKNTCNETQFDEEVDLWLRRNADDYAITQNPVKALTSGRGNLVNWLAQSWCRAKYQTNGNENTSTSRNGGIPQQRKVNAHPTTEELKRKYNLL